ncbi:13625_t:CDS:1, partial [Racocetra persica]
AFTDGFYNSPKAVLNTETYIEMPYNICISYKCIYKTLNQRKEYIVANGFSKKAIQIELDAGPFVLQELNDFMKDFITKHVPRPNQELLQKSFRKILSATSYNIQDYDSRSDDSDSSDSNYDDKKSYL